MGAHAGGRAARRGTSDPTRSSSGTTISAAKASSPAPRLGATTMLEVNAPVIDHQGSAKQWLDRALVVEPMRRWRERISPGRRT